MADTYGLIAAPVRDRAGALVIPVEDRVRLSERGDHLGSLVPLPERPVGNGDAALDEMPAETLVKRGPAGWRLRRWRYRRLSDRATDPLPISILSSARHRERAVLPRPPVAPGR